VPKKGQISRRKDYRSHAGEPSSLDSSGKAVRQRGFRLAYEREKKVIEVHREIRQIFIIHVTCNFSALFPRPPNRAQRRPPRRSCPHLANFSGGRPPLMRSLVVVFRIHRARSAPVFHTCNTITISLNQCRLDYRRGMECEGTQLQPTISRRATDKCHCDQTSQKETQIPHRPDRESRYSSVDRIEGGLSAVSQQLTYTHGSPEKRGTGDRE
jgi:hypothetical protein